MLSLLRQFPALAEPGVRRYMAGQVASVLGTWVQNITLSLLLWELTHSPVMLGVLNFLLFGPALVVGPLTGSRLAPATARATVLRVLAGSMLVTATLLAIAFTRGLTPVVLLVAAGVQGVLSAMEMPARQLLLTSSLADRTLLPNAVAMNTVVFNVGRMVGPAIAAVVFSLAGHVSAFVLNLLGLLLMRLCLAGLHAHVHTGPVARAAGLRGALSFARQDAFARRYLPTLVCMGLFVGSYQTLIPVLAAREYGQAAAFTGLFFSCAGAGSLCAALLLASRHAPGEAALRCTPWLSAAALAGVAASAWPALAAPCFVLIGFTFTFTSTCVNATLQHRAPDAVRGGMVGLYGMAFIGSAPIGHLMVGALSAATGPRWAFAALSIALVSSLGLLAALVAAPASFTKPIPTPRRP
ncbi:MAG: MFS transporter [Burkholderiales bacterium]|jgi:MFS family permease|nr:MFS transporter [Burkholderiales bacterium]